MLGKIAGRWWLVAICLAIGIVASLIYLVTAPKVYTATCVLSAELDHTGTPAGDVAPDDFLYQQRDLIKSAPVLASAATAMITSDGHVRSALDVSVAKGEGVVTIAYSASAPDEAARGANAIADAYLRTRSQQQTSTTSGLTDLTKQRDRLTADRTTKESANRAFRDTTGTAGSDAERAAAARIAQLQQAVTAAEVEAANASAAAAAGKEALADPQQIRPLIQANRNKGIFDRLEAQRTAVESELAQLEPQLEKQRQSMLPQHPVLVATKRKVDQLKAKLDELDTQYAGIYAAHLEQQRTTAQKRVEELKQLVGEQSETAKGFTARAAKLAEMDAELKKVDAAIAEVDQKIREVTVGAGASAAPTVKVVVSAQPPRRPSRPDRNRTMLTAAAIGLIAGLALAAALPGRRGD
ncbi:MAG: hypothetical protein QOE14_3015 [Humisphaera sp.]|nr:hypothetical protein [Humisphaera sp.]